LTQSRLEMMFSRTSGHSSFSWLRNKGSRCSIVLRKKSKILFPQFQLTFVRYVNITNFNDSILINFCLMNQLRLIRQHLQLQQQLLRLIHQARQLQKLRLIRQPRQRHQLNLNNFVN
jgi:hypothetical protein